MKRHEFVRAMKRAAEHDDDDDDEDKPSRPQCPEAAAHDLLVRYRKMQEKHEFKPGDLVRAKPDVLGYRMDGPMVVVTTDQGDVAAKLGAREPAPVGRQIEVNDMIVAHVNYETCSIMEHAVDSGQQKITDWIGGFAEQMRKESAK